MFYCVQTTPRGIVFCVSQLSGEVNAPNIVPIDAQLYEKVDLLLGKKYAFGRFYGLEAVVNGQQVTVSWRDLDGNLINETEEVKAQYDGIEVPITMTNGQGVLTVEADQPGTYRVKIVSVSGCQTEAEVTINA